MHQNKFYPYLGLSYPYPGKGIAHTMKYEPNRGIPCQLWPTTMSTSTNNHISSLRTRWQPLHWWPTTLATITNKSGNNNHRENHPRPAGNYLEIEAMPSRFSASNLHDWKATGKRWNPLGRTGSAKNRPKQQPNKKRATKKCQEHQKQPKLMEDSRSPLICQEQQKQRPNTAIYQAGLWSDLNLSSDLYLSIGSTTPTTTASKATGDNH